MNIETNVFTTDEIEKFRNDTNGCRYVNHMNNAGAGLMPDVVTQSVQEHIKLESEIGGYEASAWKAQAVHEFYEQAALLVNTKPTNIAFTASATDSYTRALSSIPFEHGDVILTDCDDFISNQIQFISCQKRFGLRIERIRNAAIGGVDVEDLERKLHQFKPRLLAITHIPTNSGLVQPVDAIADVYRTYKQKHPGKTWYILDACQSAGQLKLDVVALCCDFLTVTNRKFLRGPRGTGFLFISDEALQSGLEPLFIDMRGAEWIEKDVYLPKPGAIRFEDWEFAYALLLGSSEAIKYCRNIGEEKIEAQVRMLSNYLRQQLEGIDEVRVLDRGPQLGALVTFHVNELKPQFIVSELLRRKINVVPSFRNFAIIDFDEKGVEWAIRASPHYYNTIEEIDELVEAVQEIIR
jgi:selenocysteine lyase/cysteine desulfurase